MTETDATDMLETQNIEEGSRNDKNEELEAAEETDPELHENLSPNQPDTENDAENDSENVNDDANDDAVGSAADSTDPATEDSTVDVIPIEAPENALQSTPESPTPPQSQTPTEEPEIANDSDENDEVRVESALSIHDEESPVEDPPTQTLAQPENNSPLPNPYTSSLPPITTSPPTKPSSPMDTKSPSPQLRRKQPKSTHKIAPLPSPSSLPSSIVNIPPSILVTVHIREIILSSDAEDSFFASLAIVYNTKPAQLYNISSHMDVPIPKTESAARGTTAQTITQGDEKRTEVVRGNQLQFQANCFFFDLQKSQINGEERLFPGAFLLKLWQVKGNENARPVASGEVRLNQIDHLLSQRNGSKKIQINLIEEVAPGEELPRKSVFKSGQEGSVYATSILEFSMNSPGAEQSATASVQSSPTPTPSIHTPTIQPPQAFNSVSPDISPSKNHRLNHIEDDEDDLANSTEFEDDDALPPHGITQNSLSIHELQQELKSKRATIDKLLEDICSKEDVIAALTNELKHYKKKCHQHEEGLRHLKKRLATYEQMDKFHSSESMYEALQDEQSHLMRRYERLEREYKKLRTSHKQQGRALAKSQEQTKKYQGVCSTQETVIEKLERLLEKNMLAKREAPRDVPSKPLVSLVEERQTSRTYPRSPDPIAPPSSHSMRRDKRSSPLNHHKDSSYQHRDRPSRAPAHHQPETQQRVRYTRKQLYSRESSPMHPDEEQSKSRPIVTPPPETIEATRRSQQHQDWNSPHAVSPVSRRFTTVPVAEGRLPSLFGAPPHVQPTNTMPAAQSSLHTLLHSSEQQRLALQTENEQLKHRTRRMEEILHAQIEQYSKEISDLKVRMLIQENVQR